MKTSKFAKYFLVTVGLAFLSVAIQALIDPNSIMANVGVTLDTISAKSSIRAYYGGVNLLFGLFLIWNAFKTQREGLILTVLYGGGFVLGRLLSFGLDGIPGSFILTWFAIELSLTVIGLILLRGK